MGPAVATKCYSNADNNIAFLTSAVYIQFPCSANGISSLVLKIHGMSPRFWRTQSDSKLPKIGTDLI